MSQEIEKVTKKEAKWVANLRLLMKARGLNPRRLSLRAGLNQTAVRDMLEGRTQYPRYDTVQSLSDVLGVTPAQLMSGMGQEIQDPSSPHASPSSFDHDLDLLTEIITNLQEVALEHKQNLAPRDFAAMVTTLYHQTKPEKNLSSSRIDNLKPKILDLLAYESLRRVARN